jgi:hypothetical protein
MPGTEPPGLVIWIIYLVTGVTAHIIAACVTILLAVLAAIGSG